MKASVLIFTALCCQAFAEEASNPAPTVDRIGVGMGALGVVGVILVVFLALCWTLLPILLLNSLSSLRRELSTLNETAAIIASNTAGTANGVAALTKATRAGEINR